MKLDENLYFIKFHQLSSSFIKFHPFYFFEFLFENRHDQFQYCVNHHDASLHLHGKIFFAVAIWA